MSSDTRCAFVNDYRLERNLGPCGLNRAEHNEQVILHAFVPPGDTQDQELCKRLTVGAITLTHGFQHVLDPAVLEDAADRITTLLEENAAIFKSLAAANERWEAAEADLAQAREVIAKLEAKIGEACHVILGSDIDDELAILLLSILRVLPVEPGDA